MRSGTLLQRAVLALALGLTGPGALAQNGTMAWSSTSIVPALAMVLTQNRQPYTCAASMMLTIIECPCTTTQSLQAAVSSSTTSLPSVTGFSLPPTRYDIGPLQQSQTSPSPLSATMQLANGTGAAPSVAATHALTDSFNYASLNSGAAVAKQPGVWVVAGAIVGLALGNSVGL